jgi:hypothetical protein
VPGLSFTSAQLDYLKSTGFTLEGYRNTFPEDTRSFEALARARRRHTAPRDLRVAQVTLWGDEDDAPSGSIEVRQPATDEEWLAYFDQKESADALALANTTLQREAEWTPLGNLPVGVVFTGDWHLGAHGVDYDALDFNLRTIQTTPGLYAVGMGDYLEGVSVYDKARGSLYTGAYNDPEEQDESVRLRASRLRGKWLGWCAGNHDEMHARHTGMPRTKAMAETLGCPYFGEGGGTIYANVGSQRYVLGVRHHFGGKTSNTVRRMIDEWPAWERLHVAVMAHLHFNEIQAFPRNGERCWGLRSGTFKTFDEYGESHGFRSDLGTPMVILFPSQERVLAFSGADFDVGVSVLKTLRREASR